MMQKEMTHTPKVSVVIPMYNCEEFVPGLLHMFSDQRFVDFEVICVIDGATDGTEKAVKKYCEKDNRFKYVLRENGGPGAARNTGLDFVNGDYIVFSDADDEYSRDYLKRLFETAVKHDAQVVMCSYIERNCITNKDTVLGFDERRFCEDITYSHFEIENIFVSVRSRITNKLFNSKFIMENNLRFPETKAAEDSFFTYAALSVAERIHVLYEPLIVYRLYIAPESLTSKRRIYSYESVYVLRKLYQWLKDHSLLDVHGVDYLRRVNTSLLTDGGFGPTPRYISEMAHMLNAEEPFDTMNSGEILNYLQEGLLAKGAYRKEKELSDVIDPEIVENDAGLLLFKEKNRNKIHTAELLKQVSYELYGRDFHNPWSIPFASRQVLEDAF